MGRSAGRTVLGVDLCPPKVCGALIPSICECGLIWEQGLCRHSCVRMKSSGWAPIAYTWRPRKKREP